MKRVVKFLTTLFLACLGLGFVVSRIELKRGKKGWVDSHKPYGIYEEHIKRPLDFGLSLFVAIILCPLFFIVTVAVKINVGSPVLFRQKRVGVGEKSFVLIKYRSMKYIYDEFGVPLPDEKRITRLGSIIRKLSIDEIPSFINILKGDMSLVGPRPLPTNYLPWYKTRERVRHDVRGGLTGLAQVNGRNTVSWEEKFSYDIKYVGKITFINDLRILVKTVKVVLGHKDIGMRGVDSPPDFHVYRSGLTEQELKRREI